MWDNLKYVTPNGWVAAFLSAIGAVMLLIASWKGRSVGFRISRTLDKDGRETGVELSGPMMLLVVAILFGGAAHLIYNGKYVTPAGTLAAILTLLGGVCFVLVVWTSRRTPFAVNRTAGALGGGHRLEISKPLVYAIGAIFCLGLAAGLLGYRALPRVGQVVNAQK